MTARVNLMKAEEFRRQGPVSTAFIIRGSVMTAALFALIFGALTLMQNRNARQQLIVARELWKAREPMYRQTLAMKQDVATKRKLDQELQGWRASRIEWNKPVAILPQIVPPSIQFRRLNIRGDTEIRVTKGKAASAGVPARLFFLLIEGRASGRLAEDSVLQFDAALRRAPAFRTLLESVRLQRVQSEEARTEGQSGRAFAIEAATGKREMR